MYISLSTTVKKNGCQLMKFLFFFYILQLIKASLLGNCATDFIQMYPAKVVGFSFRMLLSLFFVVGKQRAASKADFFCSLYELTLYSKYHQSCHLIVYQLEHFVA